MFTKSFSIYFLLILLTGIITAAEPRRLETVVADGPGTILQNSLVWVPDAPVFWGMPAAFRKVCRLDQVPKQAKLRIFADSRYVLWINGTYVGRGPSRFDIDGPEYDTYDITKHLIAGENLFAVFAFASPEGANNRAMKHEPGLGVVMETDGAVAWTTRDGWTCSTKTRYEKILGASDHIEDGVVDLRRECGEWWLPSFAASDWQNPAPVDGAKWGPLTASRIPHLREKEVRVGLPAGVVLPITLKAGERLHLSTEGTTLGYLRLIVEATDGAELQLPGMSKSRYVLRAGHQEISTIDTRGRPPKFEILVRNGAVTLRGIHLIERLYPFDQVGAFECNDPMLTSIWDYSVNTGRLLSEDSYTSGAIKERSEWMDNSPPSFDITRVAFAGINEDGTLTHSDPRLQAATLRRIGLSLQPNGCVKALTAQECHDLHAIMEDRACEWIRAFRIHYEATGSTDVMQEMWPAIASQLDFFVKNKTERGLIRCRDWVVWGNPLSYAVGETTTLNAFVYRAFVDGAWIAGMIGKQEDAKRYTQEAEALDKAMNAILWDESSQSYYAGYFSDADLAIKNRGMARFRFEERLRVQNHLCEPTWHANLFMVNRGPVPPARIKGTLAAALNMAEPPTWSIMEYYYYGNLLYRLDQPELDLKVLQFIRQGWSRMAGNKNRTVWEKFTPNGYDDHPYGMVPAWFLSTYVLGVRWKDGIPINRMLVIEPHPGDLSEARGSVETEAGPVKVAWKIAEKRITISGSSPITATLRLRSPTATINGVRTSGKSDGNRYAYPISAGDFTALADAESAKPTLSRHAQKVEAIRNGQFDLVLIGDSITASLEGGGEWEANKATWLKYYAPRNALNLGYGGYRTENILKNLQDGELDFKQSPKVFVLLIGTNDTDDQHYKNVHTAEQVFAGTKAIVDLIRQRHPTSKIIVLRPFPCGIAGDETPFRRKYNRSQKMADELKKAGEMTRQLADGKQVFWIDVGNVFLLPNGKINPSLMPDLIHPNGAGAEAAAKALEPLLAKVFGDNPILD